ncbi:MAG TPA: sporulation protein YqfC [Bacillus sp. (in: firmicutes)]|uniref:sporulation protein YqfC n=1 Tax=Bacillus litorisediminis TaxID=2922713 RepID=UPI001FAD442A|nr:sporulation protein YqfC [Bacillus litorisediminis]HWO77688.1 sporulation protein YqfC [Bacillus sp. (in: firmicutes)]
MARKLKAALRNLLTTKLDLPPDVMMDLPRITMIGQLHLYIENHKGLLSFAENEIRVLLDNGQLLIKGKGLVIKAILPEEILLEGRISQVSYLDSK